MGELDACVKLWGDGPAKLDPYVVRYGDGSSKRASRQRTDLAADLYGQCLTTM